MRESDKRRYMAEKSLSPIDDSSSLVRLARIKQEPHQPPSRIHVVHRVELKRPAAEPNEDIRVLYLYNNRYQ